MPVGQEHKEDVYNLAFGDWDEDNHRINDLAVTNNSDRDKVLATVAATVLEFMNDHPQAIVLAIGSTRSRTRLYQMGIARIWDQISLLFEIQGYINEEWQPFQKVVNFDAFLLKEIVNLNNKNQLMKGNTTKKKVTAKAKVVTDKAMKDYTNDPYFVKKRETAEAFLKKAGLPEFFTKPQK